MATPIIQSNGSVSGLGTAGQGRNDLQIGEVVTLSDVEAANAGGSYVWAFEDIPIGSSATLNNAMTATPDFSPDIEGSYRVRATVGGVDISFEILAVPLPNTGARIPSFDEELGYDGGGNLKGWHEAQTAWMRSVDSGIGGGGGNDPFAVHVNVAAEINGIALKATPVAADVAIIEDSAAGFAKKSVLVSALQNDPFAFHSNVVGEFNSLPFKAVAGQSDALLIEDPTPSPTPFQKKKISISSIPMNTLEDAYNEGGAGAGRIVDVISGPILLRNNATNTNDVLEITKNPGAPQFGDGIDIDMGSNCTGRGIGINHSGTGRSLQIASSSANDALYVNHGNVVGHAAWFQNNIAGNTEDVLRVSRIPAAAELGNGIGIVMTNLAGGDALHIDHFGEGEGIKILKDGLGYGLHVVHSGFAEAVRIDQSADEHALDINQTGAGNAVDISLAGAPATARGLWVTSGGAAISQSLVSFLVSTTAATGTVLSLARTPAGANSGDGLFVNMGANCSGHAVEINHDGSGRAILVRRDGTGYGIDFSLSAGTDKADIRLSLFAADPTTPAEGDFWYNTTANKFRGYDGTTVVDFH